MPYAAINDVKDTLEHEHSNARGMVTEVEHDSCGKVKVVSPPVKYGKPGMVGVRSAPPTLGQHTEGVLQEVLGYQASQVKGLREKGIVA